MTPKGKVDFNWDWSSWLVGFWVDRYYNYFNDRKNTDLGLCVGPLSIAFYL